MIQHYFLSDLIAVYFFFQLQTGDLFCFVQSYWAIIIVQRFHDILEMKQDKKKVHRMLKSVR